MVRGVCVLERGSVGGREVVEISCGVDGSEGRERDERFGGWWGSIGAPSVTRREAGISTSAISPRETLDLVRPQPFPFHRSSHTPNVDLNHSTKKFPFIHTQKKGEGERTHLTPLSSVARRSRADTA